MRLPRFFNSGVRNNVLAAVVLATLWGCENPADKTVDAQVSAAQGAGEASTPADAVKYVFTGDSSIGFIGSKVSGAHEGGFKAFTGHFMVKDGAPVGNEHRVVIDMDSTWSDSEKLTGHLKNADFFDVEKFPETTFEGVEITRSEDGNYRVAGDFTLHGVTKRIAFPTEVVVADDGKQVSVKAEFDINRKDFGIVYPGKSDDLIRDEVVIKLDLTAIPEA